MDETEGFLKLHPSTLLTIINCGLDTTTLDMVNNNLFDFILYEMPSPLNGHKLSEEEASDYLKLLRDVSLFLGFDITKE